MQWNKPKLLTIALILIALFLLAQSAHAPTTQTHTLDTKGSDGCYFQFDNSYTLWFDAQQIYLGNSNGLWTWLDNNGIRFYNLRMDGDSLETWSIRTENANVTVTSLFKDSKLDFTVTAPSWTVSTTQVYCGDYGKPYSVSGASTWSYNYATNIATITVLHFSPQAIELEWVLPPSLAISIQNNYFLAFTLISLVPIAMVSMIIVAVIRGRENMDLKAVLAITAFIIALLIGFIILINIMNALL